MKIFTYRRFVKLASVFGATIFISYIMLIYTVTNSNVAFDINFVTGIYKQGISHNNIQVDLPPNTTVGIVLPMWLDSYKTARLNRLTIFRKWLPMISKDEKLRDRLVLYFGTEYTDLGLNTSRAKTVYSSVTLKAVPTSNETLIAIANILARTAYLDGMDYIVRVAESHVTSGDWNLWLKSAVRALENLHPPHVGVVVPVYDNEEVQSPVQEVVHKTHLDIFFHYFPPELDSKYAHNWLRNVYTHAQTYQLVLKRTSEAISRSRIAIEVKNIAKEEKRIINRDRSRLQSYLVQHEIIPIPSNRERDANSTADDYFLGAVVVMAPRRNQGLPGYEDDLYGPRLCLFFHMMRSVDEFLNLALGTHYPIFVILSADPYEDPYNKDGYYTPDDRERIRSWAPNSDVRFIELNMYTKDALTPGTNLDLILRWERGEDGAVAGRPLGYRSMCRLWSGRIQQMPFIQKFKYYMRLDDDSLFRHVMPRDPFKEMEALSLTYAYVRRSTDRWGYQHLVSISKPYGKLSGPYVPYTNFHMAKSEFFLTENVTRYWKDLEKAFAFYKYRIGDATLHGALLDLFLTREDYGEFRWIPYAHNSNDYRGYPPKHWAAECGPIEIRLKDIG